MNKNFSKIVLAVIAVVLLTTVIITDFITPDSSNVSTATEPTDNLNEDDTIVNEDVICDDTITYKKPVIYLYPETDTNVTVTLQNPESLICSYPKYNNGWNIIAHADGRLTDIETNRELYALYYEANLDLGVKLSRTGFVVERENLISFLEEKLTILGLTDREANEFIIYWLPILEQNEYNYIYFATNEEVNDKFPLEIYPTPDTMIRVCMYYVGLESPMKFAEQTLEPVKRTGFTVVEWGGAELEGVLLFKPKLPQNDIRIPPYRLPKFGKNN